MTSTFYSREELVKLGFQAVGDEVFISRKAALYGCENMEIGSHVRIDDFCILSGKVRIGNYVHIAPYSSLCGGSKGIILEDFVNVSRKVEIFAVSDDFSGNSMTNPMIPDQYKKVIEAEVVLKKHVVIGAGSIILPGVIVEEGTAIGALSLVKESTPPWSIYAGIPAIKVKDRKQALLQLETNFMSNKGTIK